MTDKEAMVKALEALEGLYISSFTMPNSPISIAIAALKERLAQPEQEADELTIAYMSGLYDGKKKRTWVGLTDEEIHNLDPLPHQMFDTQRIKFARAIEAAHGIKENT